jgi:predicted secreted protein
MVFPLVLAAAGGGVAVWLANTADDAAENFGITSSPSSAPNTLQVVNQALALALVVAVLYGGYYLFTRR